MTSDGVAGGKPLTEGKWAGWAAWSDPRPDTFLQAIGRGYMRGESATKALVGLETRSSHRNRLDSLHGGFLAAFADHAYFGGLWAMGHVEQINGVTIDLSMQYLGSGKVGPDLFAEVELLRETGRLMFLRMLITQDGQPVAASTATLRKAPTPK
ncbi:Acyl-coenzyme A thioesterase PaaI, contains HGG motif [Sphingobium sp. AP50]|uniref:PaaI family thioesterase n=1 Tax=Sphingobium sp. AP50 TaxID=1884369 RepID=UPI0008AB6ED8|nr:PaaI family thioesterase [Sphingobium sp. AP50]SEI79833.1 Acyl-coenzyme A thioesterase PaaI, contains HGG motif [Sphingobium sp. AP50]